jgi:ankyrin repeat protein
MPQRLHPKAEELLALVRSDASKIRAYKFFLELSPQDKTLVAINLHNNPVIIFNGYDQLHSALIIENAQAEEKLTKLTTEFVDCLNTINKNQPQGSNTPSKLYISKLNQAKRIIQEVKDKFGIDRFDSFDCNLFLYAAIASNAELIEELLDNGADPQLESPQRQLSSWGYILQKIIETSTQVAEVNKYKEILDLLISRGVNPLFGVTQNYITENGTTSIKVYFEQLPEIEFMDILFRHIESGSLDKQEISTLIDNYGFDAAKLNSILNARNFSRTTLLMHAILHKNDAAIDWLLDNNIDTNQQNLDGNTALHIALINKNIAAICKLMSYKNTENPEWQPDISILNNEGISAISLVQMNNLHLIGNQVLEHKTYKNFEQILTAISHKNVAEATHLIKELLRQPPEEYLPVFNTYLYPRISLLAACAEFNELELFKMILNSGLIIDKKTQLQLAMLFAALSNATDILDYIIKHENIDVNFFDGHNTTPLLAAIESKSKDAASLLINYNAWTDAKNTLGETPLMCAAQQGMYDVCRALKERGADINVQAHNGSTALKYATQNGFDDIAALLLDGDLKQAQYTDLMLAVLDKDLNKVTALAHSNPRAINLVNVGGFSALMIAANKYAQATSTEEKEIYFKVIKILLQNGASATIENRLKNNFLKLLSKSNTEISPEHLLELYKIFKEPGVTKAHNGKNIFHIAVMSGVNIIPTLYTLNNNPRDLNIEINKLDDDGNSPLSFILLDIKQDFEPKAIYDLVVKYGARFIRNQREILWPLHIKAMLDLPEHKSSSNFDTIFNTEEQHNINARAQYEGRTALHFACLHDRQKLAINLIGHGANLTIQDSYSRNPLHYAAFHNMHLPNVTAQELDATDIFGITPLTIYYQHASTRADFAQYASLYNSLNNFINTDYLLKFGTIEPDTLIRATLRDARLNYKQKLAILEALHKYYEINEPERIEEYTKQIDAAENTIISKEFANPEVSPVGTLPLRSALGIEIEIPQLLDMCYIPLPRLTELLGGKFVFDITVKRIPLHTNTYPAVEEFLELTSDPPIKIYQQLWRFLALVDAINQSGSKVNASAGLHVHFNIRKFEGFVRPSEELDFLKYLILNYVKIENLLRGFIRNGELYESFGSVYIEPIVINEEMVQNCRSIEELQSICAHINTLDLTALDRHGTVEFRLHEATINPILIYAWVDMLSRIVFASKFQTEQHHPEAEHQSKPNIELLVDYLIGMRHYNATWNAPWGAFSDSETVTTSAYPGNDTRPIQVQIQEAPLYNMIQIIVNPDSNDENLAQKLKDYMHINTDKFSIPGNDAHLILADLEKLVILLNEAPGLLLDIPDNTLEIIKELRQTQRNTLNPS